MKKIVLVVGLLTSLFSFASYNVSKSDEIINGYQFEGNGWQNYSDCFDSIFKQDNLKMVSLRPQQALDQGLTNQLAPLNQLLANGKTSEVEKVQIKQSIGVLDSVSKQLGTDTKEIYLSGFKYYRLAGEDGCGNVLLTGYFTPTLKLKRSPDAVYRYPLYRKPEFWPNNKILTRAQIDTNNGLKGLGLEIGYSASLLDNYFAHVQGSTFGYFIDTNEYVTLAFAGKNGKKYASLGKYLVSHDYIEEKDISLTAIREFFAEKPQLLSSLLTENPSYVFFREVKTLPITSSGVPVLNKVTVAVDPSVIPYGSLLLVEFPLIGSDGLIRGRDFRLVIASDSGSAIKGKGHIDLYLGQNEFEAGQLHHYGRVWLITE